jgi:hypothetical protein
VDVRPQHARAAGAFFCCVFLPIAVGRHRLRFLRTLFFKSVRVSLKISASLFSRSDRAANTCAYYSGTKNIPLHNVNE